MAIIFIAHRGAPRQGRRENTIAAFQRAAESGRFAWIEMDVRRTRTDENLKTEAIIAHHPSTDQVYDLQRRPKSKRKYAGLALSSLTKEMLRNDDIDIPTLAEVLREVNPHPLNLNLKNMESVTPTLEVLRSLVERSSNPWSWEHFVVSAHHWPILDRLKEMEPRLPLGLLYGYGNFFNNPFKAAYRLQIRFVSVHHSLAWFMGPLLTFFGVNHRYVYTVNYAWQVKILRLFAINGFTTDSVTLPEQTSS